MFADRLLLSRRLECNPYLSTMASLWWLAFLVAISSTSSALANDIQVYIRSEGCNDPKWVNVYCGRAYIYVNGIDRALKMIGHNVVLVDHKTGTVEQVKAYNTYSSSSKAYNMATDLTGWARNYPGKVVLVAIQADGSRYLNWNVQNALMLVGAKKPFTHGYMGSYALVGYTGPEKPNWIRQVQNVAGRGPSIISIRIPKAQPPVTSRPPVTAGPTSGSCGRRISSRVIGGENAVPGAWPWQIGIIYNNQFICGGSLIEDDWIVTAAHCISSLSGSSYTILLGAHNRYSPEGHEQKIRGRRVIKHPRYNQPTLNNDIALIQLERPAKLGSRVRTVCLPPSNYELPVSSTCYITGWGKIKHPGSSHHTLQQAKLTPVTKDECKRKLAQSPGGYQLSITDQMLCAGVDGTNLSGCHGDSGGPYVCPDSSGRFFLQGVVSWGSTTCSTSERYTVFARVGKLRSWIDQEIQNARG